jgi:hypothetical protein
MAYKHYTQCFLYPSGGKPYNEKDRVGFVIKQVLLTLAVGGTFALVGLLAGPLGAVILGIFGSLVGLTQAISNAANEWLFHRLICLNKDNPQCAVGIVSYNPTRSDLGAFDNDQYFDVVLMPHPAVSVPASVISDADIEKSNETALVPGNRYKDDGTIETDRNVNGTLVRGYANEVKDYPANQILIDGIQGQAFLTTRADIEKDLGYAALSSHERNALHCEAEGKFWVTIDVLAPALAAVAAAALVATAAGAAAGSALGSSIGCAILSFFFGPAGCAVGGFLGGLVGGALGGAAAGAASYYGVIQPILQAIFDADPGDVEDANIGDQALGPIRIGDKVAVLGEHVYDGYHDGWNEFHPLMAVVKLGTFSKFGFGPEYYLDWQPDSPGTPPSPPPGETVVLTLDDMKQGLNSANFRTRCKNLKDTWCAMLNDAFSPPTRQTQQKLENRWAVHPMVDGCRPADPGPSPLH